MAVGLKEVQVLLDKYMDTVRHSDMPRLAISELYDLNAAGADDGALRWPAPYPHGGEAGVYLVLDEHQQVLYIGKASWSSCIAARLNSYFMYAPDSSCYVIHNWSSPPRYICVIPVTREYAFEAAALEEYLICGLPDCPPDNTIGQARRRRKAEAEIES